jgi:hypothetical protein
LIYLSFRFADLNEDPASFELQLVAIFHVSSLQPVRVAYQVRLEVIDHNTFVKGVEAEQAILPAFRLSTYVMCVEAGKEVNGGGVLIGGSG